MPTHKHWRIIAWSMVIVLLILIGPASGATRTWSGTTSTDWSNSNNWSGAVVPVAGDAATISSSAANLCALGGATQSLITLTIGNTDPATYGKLIVQEGGMITNPTVSVGYGASYYGYLEVQSNASFYGGSNYLMIGGSAGGNGTVNVNGGTLFGPVNGGSSFAVGTLAAGYGNRPGTGILNVASGGYMKGYRVYVGFSGIGVMNISNAETRVECGYELSVGCATSDGQGDGTVNLMDGTLNVTGGQGLNNAYQYLYYDGTKTNIGRLNLRGGQLLVTGNLKNSVAETNREVGTITIASGATNLLVSGSYYQRTNCTLVAEITSTGHPPLKVNGIAYLAGTLRVASNSMESRGQWDIIIGDANNDSGTAGLSGRFNTFDTSAAGHPGNWFLSYTADKVILRYIPKATVFSFY